ncbi:MAG TPA: hypothetical protein VGS79_22050 [Puia sp.]|nr:hypothetical protein [Puia sp.]
MESLITYVIRCVLVSGLLTSYYVLALRGRRMHTFNRFYLLSSVVVALVLPLVHIPWAPWAVGHVTVERVFITPAAPVKSGGAFLGWFALGASVLVSIVLLLVSLAKIRVLYRLKRASRCTRLDDYELVETDAPGTPFSFLRNLFWRSGMDRDGDVGREMLAHELAHIRGRHSWDILGMQAVVCLLWVNPFFWYMRRELTVVLEFAADAASGAEGDPEVLARMLLQAYQGDLSPALANSFFYSPIKRRLIMITKTSAGRRAWMRKALVAPVVLGAVLFFACSKDQTPQAAAKVQPLSPPALALGKIVADGAHEVRTSKEILIVKDSTGEVLKRVPLGIDHSKPDGKMPIIVLDSNRIGIKN